MNHDPNDPFEFHLEIPAVIALITTIALTIILLSQ